MHPRRTPLRAVALSIVLVPFFLFFQTSCQYAGSIVLTSASMGVAYYYMNVAEQTFTIDMERMTTATQITLKRLGFAIHDQSLEEEDVRKIKAETEDLNIIVKLKRITNTCTKMTVKVREGLTMDKATALELIAQTGETARKLKRKG